MPCTFTIIVPTHLRPALLSRTLQSLAAQTYAHFKVIVVDDAGAYIPPYQDLAALQGKYTFVIRSGISGPGPSRNLALALVDTDYVIFLDDDDAIAPTHLQAMVEHLRDQRPPLLFCDFTVQNEDRTATPSAYLSSQKISLAHITRDSVYVLNGIPNSCLVYRSELLANVRYDTDLEIYEDWDFLLSCLRHQDLMHVPINSVIIHKSLATAPENMRRGNTRDDLIPQTMLMLYKRHPAPNAPTRQARQALMASAGIQVPLTDC